MAAKHRPRRPGPEWLRAALALVLTFAVGLPVWPVWAEKAAVAAVAAALPESGLYRLRQRFAPELAAEEPGEPVPIQPQPAPAEETAPEQEPQPSQPDSTPAPQPDEPVPEQYQGTLLRETMTGSDDGTWLDLGGSWLRNYTGLTFAEIEAALAEAEPLAPTGEEGSQVLILHTHATEGYESHTGDTYDTRSSWRTQNEDENMCAIGKIIAEELEAAGIGVIHNTTQHDYPSYNGSYDRSRATAEEILAENPSIRVVLDVHRDAIQRDESTIVAPVTTVGGQSCAQVMLIVGCDDGSLNLPNWRQNLWFGAQLQNRLEADWPTLTRPLFFAHRKYNQDIGPAAVLVEVGSSANTLEEAARAAHLVGQSLAALLEELEE